MRDERDFMLCNGAPRSLPVRLLENLERSKGGKGNVFVVGNVASRVRAAAVNQVGVEARIVPPVARSRTAAGSVGSKSTHRSRARSRWPAPG